MSFHDTQVQSQVEAALSALVTELHQVGVSVQGLVLEDALDLLVEGFNVK